MATYDDYQQLSNDVYNHGGNDQIVIGSNVWNKVAGTENGAGGYNGSVYMNADTHEVILVNKGTSTVRDGVSDAQMLLEHMPIQYDGARQLMQQAEAIAHQYDAPLSVTGHSLGGSLANLLGVEYGVPAVGFNALGVGPLLANEANSPLPVAFLEYPTLMDNFEKHFMESEPFNNIVNFTYGNDATGNIYGQLGLTDNIPTGEGTNPWPRIGDALLFPLEDMLKLRWSDMPSDFMDSLFGDHGIANFDPFGMGLPPGINSLFTSLMTGRDPLVLDLDGDGIEGTSINAGIEFDMNNDGVKTRTGWVAGDDGFLVRDLNNNGVIDSGQEMFGSDTVLANGQKAVDAYSALKEMDSNGDGIIDASDEGFDKLQIWQDKNQDGITQADELKTLSELGITALSTNGVLQNKTLTEGVVQQNTSTYTREDGTMGQTGGLNFNSNNFYSNFTDKIDISSVADLPDIQGSGMVRSLREAMVLDPELKTLVATYIASDVATQAQLITELVTRWANTATMQSSSDIELPRFSNELMPIMNVLEKFNGNRYPSSIYYGNALIQGYHLLLQSVSEALNLQTTLQPALSTIDVVIKNGTTTLDFSRFYNSYLIPGLADNAEKTVAEAMQIYAIAQKYWTDQMAPEQSTTLLSWIEERLSVDHINPGDYLSQFAFTDSSGKLFFYGGAGDDRLAQSNYTATTFVGGKGNDYFYGSDTNDTYIFNRGDGQDTIQEWRGNDTLQFGEGVTADDLEWSRHYNDLIIKIKNSDDSITILNHFTGADTFGNYFIPIENIRFADGNNHTIAELINAEGSFHYTTNDTKTYGTSADETFMGGDGNNEIRGVGGNDVYIGGKGNDFLIGGSGNDTYVFNRGDGQDQLYDEGGIDTLQFGEGITLADLEYSRDNASLIIKIKNSSDQLYLINTLTKTGGIEKLTFADGSSVQFADVLKDQGIYGYETGTVPVQSALPPLKTSAPLTATYSPDPMQASFDEAIKAATALDQPLVTRDLTPDEIMIEEAYGQIVQGMASFGAPASIETSSNADYQKAMEAMIAVSSKG